MARKNNELKAGKFATLVMIDGKFYSPKVGMTVESAKTVLVDRLTAFCGKGDGNGLSYQTGLISFPMWSRWAEKGKDKFVISGNIDKGGRKVYIVGGDYAHLHALLDTHGKTPLETIAKELWGRLQSLRFTPVAGKSYNDFVSISPDELAKIRMSNIIQTVSQAKSNDPEPVNPKTGKPDKRMKEWQVWFTRQNVRENMPAVTTTVKPTLNNPSNPVTTGYTLPTQGKGKVQPYSKPVENSTTATSGKLPKSQMMADWKAGYGELHNLSLVEYKKEYGDMYEA